MKAKAKLKLAVALSSSVKEEWTIYNLISKIEPMKNQLKSGLNLLRQADLKLTKKLAALHEEQIVAADKLRTAKALQEEEFQKRILE